MKLSDYLAQFLAKEGIKHVFQIIGGASVHMVHSIAVRKDISYICVQHEQAGAMAAEGYSRLTKNIGAAMGTSGPGMTNLITGIAGAYFDSTPCIYITGNVNTNESKQGRNVRQIGFQETDIVDCVKSITKFSVRVEDPLLVRYYLEKAFFLARNGRPGPVLLDMPMDTQRAQISPEKLKRFNPKEIDLEVDSSLTIKKNIQQAIAYIKKAERPVVIAGGAIRYADQTAEFEAFVNALNIPVVATWSGIDVLPHDHPLYVGQIGVYGSRAGNFAVQNSDCIISMGSRLDTRITGGKPESFARAAKKIIVDIDRGELYKKRGLDPDVGICADVKDVLPLFIREVKKIQLPKIDPWKNKVFQWKKTYPSVYPQWRKRKDKVDPYMFFETLSKIAKNAIVITDTGASLTWTIQAFHVSKGQRVFSTMGNSPMGYSLPASIGASIAIGKKSIICVSGDGGMQLNIQEFQTLKYYNLPVKVFVMNNHSYGIIKQFQDMYFDGVYEGTIPGKGYSTPDFVKIAKAYGLAATRIQNHKGLTSKLKKILQYNGPIVCDVVIPDDAKSIPKLSFGNAIEDLSPELPREEFLKNMIIPLWKK